MEEREYDDAVCAVNSCSSASKLSDALLYALEVIRDLSQDSHLAKRKGSEVANRIVNTTCEDY